MVAFATDNPAKSPGWLSRNFGGVAREWDLWRTALTTDAAAVRGAFISGAGEGFENIGRLRRQAVDTTANALGHGINWATDEARHARENPAQALWELGRFSEHTKVAVTQGGAYALAGTVGGIGDLGVMGYDYAIRPVVNAEFRIQKSVWNGLCGLVGLDEEGRDLTLSRPLLTLPKSDIDCTGFLKRQVQFHEPRNDWERGVITFCDYGGQTAIALASGGSTLAAKGASKLPALGRFGVELITPTTRGGQVMFAAANAGSGAMNFHAETTAAAQAARDSETEAELARRAMDETAAGMTEGAARKVALANMIEERHGALEKMAAAGAFGPAFEQKERELHALLEQAEAMLAGDEPDAQNNPGLRDGFDMAARQPRMGEKSPHVSAFNNAAALPQTMFVPAGLLARAAGPITTFNDPATARAAGYVFAS